MCKLGRARIGRKNALEVEHLEPSEQTSIPDPPSTHWRYVKGEGEVKKK